MGSRLGAYLIDAIICVVVLVGWRAAVAPDDAGVPPLGFWVGLFGFVFMYGAVSNYLGASPGKCFLRLRVIDEDSELRPTLVAATLRAAVWMTGVVSAVWALFDTKSRALHDRVANTLVVKI
jgi:uncharacterized RDD family membrane protein YckC